MDNRVQAAVYTLWGQHNTLGQHAFDGNVIEYNFEQGEKFRQHGKLVNPGQKALDLMSQVLQLMAHNAMTDSPMIVD
eukprot:Nk52_evm1s2476 gene=Nk52_evmTU1s2476